MQLIDMLVSRLVTELAFAFAYVWVVGWAGYEWLLVLLDWLLSFRSQ
jgi:hypothetical protein